VKASTLRVIFKLLPSVARKKLILVTFFQGIISFLDVLGLSLLVVFASVLLSELRNNQLPSGVSSVMELIGLSDYTFVQRSVILGICVIVLFVSKTILGLIATRFLFNFLSQQTTLIGNSLLGKLFSSSFEQIAKKKGQRLLHAATGGVDTLVLNYLANCVIVIVEAFFLLIILTGILVIDPSLAILVLVILGATLLVLQKYIGKKSRHYALQQVDLGVKSNQILLDSLSIYRELYLTNRTHFPMVAATRIRTELNEIKASLSFLPNLNKYVLELVIVIAAFAIATLQFSISDVTAAINKLVLFLAVTTRVVPSMLRIQSATLSLKQSEGTVEPTLSLIKELENVPARPLCELDFVYRGFSPTLTLSKVSFQYLENNLPTFTLKDIDINISEGEFVAIVGPSGAGKSTLVDLMLGFRTPDQGEILISGVRPQEISQNWAGAVAFVPQNTVVIDGTIRDNITLGANLNENYLNRALTFSKLEDFIRSTPAGLEYQVGERGSKLSGGQRQRLGLARAIYTNPRLIVLDEATSSLDVVLENEISEALSKLHRKVSLIVIAHRLSTIRFADKIIYMEKGKILASGNFVELQKLVPDFQKQVILSGLEC
jgi:ABC-type multidrug transport system fused ATPase/permease subunit